MEYNPQKILDHYAIPKTNTKLSSNYTSVLKIYRTIVKLPNPFAGSLETFIEPATDKMLFKLLQF